MSNGAPSTSDRLAFFSKGKGVKTKPAKTQPARHFGRPKKSIAPEDIKELLPVKPSLDQFDLSTNFIDLIGADNVKSMVNVALNMALAGDTDLLKKFLDKAFDASSKGSSAGTKEMEERMKKGLETLNRMSEADVKRMIGDYYISLKAGRLPVAKKEG